MAPGTRADLDRGLSDAGGVAGAGGVAPGASGGALGPCQARRCAGRPEVGADEQEEGEHDEQDVHFSRPKKVQEPVPEVPPVQSSEGGRDLQGTCRVGGVT